MNGIILYKSKYGATRKYALWLSEETGFDVREIGKISVADVQEYELIILGGGIYASGIAGLDFLRKNLKKLEGKKLIVFCDGASPYEEKAFEEIKERNMKGELKDIPLYYCRGAWNMDAMSFADRTLCRMLSKAVAKKDPADYELWESALMAAGEAGEDWTDKAYLNPIIENISRYR